MNQLADQKISTKTDQTKKEPKTSTKTDQKIVREKKDLNLISICKLCRDEIKRKLHIKVAVSKNFVTDSAESKLDSIRTQEV